MQTHATCYLVGLSSESVHTLHEDAQLYTCATVTLNALTTFLSKLANSIYSAL